MSRRARRLARPVFMLRWLAVAVLVAIAVAYVQPARSYLAARKDVAKERAELEALMRRQNALRNRLASAGTDQFVVQEARRLGLVRPGERLFVVRGTERWRRTHVP